MIDIIRLNQGNAQQILIELSHSFDFESENGERLGKEHIQVLSDQDRVFILVARLEQEIVGYCLAYIFPSLYSNDYKAYLYDIEVLEVIRRNGIAKALINELLSMLQSTGVIEELWLGTGTDNKPAIKLYESTGGKRSTETFYDFTYEFSSD